MSFSVQDKEFMRLAIKKAREGMNRGQTPFGACIVKKGKAVAVAHNVVWKNMDITAHAEINCIRLACKKLKTIDLSDCVIYSTCEPCPMCFSACHWAKIKKIFFGCSIRDASLSGFNELYISNKTMKRLGKSSIKVSGGILKEENAELFKDWKKIKKRKVY